MQLRNTMTRYGGIAQALHWGIVGLIIAQYVLAELAEAAGADKAVHPAAALHQFALLARHKSVGLTIDRDVGSANLDLENSDLGW